MLCGHARSPRTLPSGGNPETDSAPRRKRIPRCGVVSLVSRSHSIRYTYPPPSVCQDRWQKELVVESSGVERAVRFDVACRYKTNVRWKARSPHTPAMVFFGQKHGSCVWQDKPSLPMLIRASAPGAVDSAVLKSARATDQAQTRGCSRTTGRSEGYKPIGVRFHSTIETGDRIESSDRRRSRRFSEWIGQENRISNAICAGCA